MPRGVQSIAPTDQVKLHLEAAIAELKLAIDSMAPLPTIKQFEAYLLGHLRAGMAVLSEAKDAIDQTTSFRKLKKKEVEQRGK